MNFQSIQSRKINVNTSMLNVTQNLGGYSWYKNSRLNRLTRWSNDSVLDYSSEEIYILQEDENKYLKSTYLYHDANEDKYYEWIDDYEGIPGHYSLVSYYLIEGS